MILHKVDGEAVETSITKTRPEDFIQELEHIKAVVTGDVAESLIDIKRGADTMLAGRPPTIRICWENELTLNIVLVLG